MSGNYNPRAVYIKTGILAEEVSEKIYETYDGTLDYMQLAKKAEEEKIKMYRNDRNFICLSDIMTYLDDNDEGSKITTDFRKRD